MHDHLIELPDGRHLAVREEGDRDGFPVVHFHGAPGWRGQSPDAPQCRLIGIDRPGVGGSTRRPGRRLVDFCADVAVVADSLDLDRFGVLGSSAGGPYALATAQELPDRVVGVALKCTAGPTVDRPDLDEHLSDRDAGLVPLVRADPEAAAEAIPDFVKPMAEAWNTDPEAGWENFVESLPPGERELFEQNRSTWEATFEAAYADPDGWADDVVVLFMPWGFDPAAIRAPVHAWHGTDDATSPWPHISRFLDSIGAQVTIIEGCGHYLPPSSDPEVCRWLQSCA